jgi:hypothetical protein
MLIRKATTTKKPQREKLRQCERKSEAKSYLISALRQQKQNKNYVISRRLLQTRERKYERKKESYLDRCKKPMSLSFISGENSMELWASSRIILETNGNQLLISDPEDYVTRRENLFLKR